MSITLFRNDLTLLLRDIGIEPSRYVRKQASGQIIKIYNPDNFVEIEDFKNFLYARYNRSEQYQFQAIPPKNLINDYLSIINRIEKQTEKSYWYFQQNLDGGALLLQKGFTEKIFETNKFNPNINPALIPEENILSFNRPYCYQDSQWFWILGDDFPVISNDELYRYYFNFNGPNFEGLTVLIRFLVNEFDCRNISYKLKLPINQEFFGRADNVVLYIDKFNFSIVADLIYKLSHSLFPFLRDDTTLFSRAITLGISFSEEPNDDKNQSFGENRIEVICDCLERIRHSNGFTTLGGIELFKKVIDEGKFQEYPLFYLNSDSIYQKYNFDFYPFDLNFDHDNFWIKPIVFQSKTYQNFYTTDSNLKCVTKIAYQLCSSSVNYTLDEEKIINNILWLKGRLKDDEDKKILIIEKTEDNFYDGRLGTAWFLINTYHYYREPLFLNTCITVAQSIMKSLEDKAVQNPFECLYFLFEYIAILKVNSNISEKGIVNIVEDEKEFIDKFNNFSSDFLKNDFLCTCENSIIELFWLTDTTLKIPRNIKLINEIRMKYERIVKNLSDIKYNDLEYNNLKICLYSKILEFECNTSSKLLIPSAVEGLKKLEETKNILYLLGIQIATKFLLYEKPYKSLCNDMIASINDSMKSLSKSLSTDSIENFSIEGSSTNAIFLLSYLNDFKSLTWFDNFFKERETVVALIDNYIEKILKNGLDRGIFPPMGLERDFYNPGLTNGVSGLGYLILRNMLYKERTKPFAVIPNIVLPIQSFLPKIKPEISINWFSQGGASFLPFV